jgi:MYXO-CTERM domain-containing protein
LLGLVALMAVFGPEREPAPPRYGVDPTRQSGAVVAVNAAGQMLVGYDDGRSNDSLVSTGDNLYFTRVTPDGMLLDLGGIELSVPGPRRDQLAMTTDGHDYLAAWAESMTSTESELRVARVGANGAVLESPTVISSAAGTAIASPHVCWDGSQYRMVFAVDDNTTGAQTLYTVRLTAAGTPVAAPAVLALPATALPFQPTIACLGGDALVAWWQYDTMTAAYDVQAAPWPASGAPGAAGSIMLPGAGQVQGVALAAGPDHFLAAWDEQRATPTGSMALVGQVLDRAGARTSAADIPLAPATPNGYLAQLTFDGSAWRVLAPEPVNNVPQVFLGTVATDGGVTIPLTAVTAGSPPKSPTSLACASGTCFVTWTGIDNNSIVFGARVTDSGTVLDSPPLFLSTPSDEQSPARLAWDGEQLLVAWGAQVGRSPAEVLIRRQDGGGVWLDPAAVSLGPATSFLATALPEGGFALVCAVANNQSPTGTDVVPVFVSRAGQVTKAAAPLFSGQSLGLYSLACGAAECHVFGQVSVADFAYRMDHQGNPLGTPLPIRCDRTLAAGAQVWCLAKPQSGATQLTLGRYDGSLNALGSPLQLLQTGERPDVGMVMQVDSAGAVTAVWSVIYTDPTLQTQTEKGKVARVGADGQVMDAPRDLPIQATNTAFFPQRLINAAGTGWLFWYANDGTTVWHLRVQQLSTALAPEGPVAELTAGGLELAYDGADAVTTANDEAALAYLVRDPTPARGSHRVRLRLTVDAAPPADGGTVDAGGASEAGTDAVADGGQPPPRDSGADGSPASVDARADAAADAGRELDASSVDAGRRQASSGGCSCRTAGGESGPRGPALLALLAAVILSARRRRRRFRRSA